MNLVYHELVQKDINGILRHYADVSSRLADDFWDEFTKIVALIKENPQRFHYEKRPIRRATFTRFPYCIAYQVFENHIKVMVVKHESRKPSFGSWRK